MRKIKLIIILGAALLFILSSCKKDPPPDNNDINISNSHGVFVINEGNFQWSNASVTYFNFTSEDYAADIFKDINNRPLGDVAQSVYAINGTAYIVVNNSGKIEMVNLNDFSSKGVISGFVSPRYFLPVSTTKAYVTDLYSNSISVVDLSTNIIMETIPCQGSTEEMTLLNDTVIITNTRSDKIYLISTITDEVTDSIQVGFASNSLQFDKNDKLWVMCAGDAANNIKASIYRVDVRHKTVEQSFQLGTALDIWDKLRINAGKDTIYYLCNGIYRMPVTAGALPTETFIAKGSCLFHGLGINPVNNTIFVADAVDYVQKGKVYYYSANGTLKGTINTGIIPVDFYFF